MKSDWKLLLGGLGFGAGLVYFLDPTAGRRRRTYLRDQVRHAGSRLVDSVGPTARDLRNRALGAAAETRARLRREAVPDEVLVARVRAAMGRAISHPGAIEVAAADGHVTLHGPILAGEEEALLETVARVRGVKDVTNRLERHRQPGNLPALQGEPHRLTRTGRARENWPPATRLLAGTAGGALAAYGASRRGAVGTTMALAGLGLLARAVTNLEPRRLTGIGAGRRGLELRKTINIAAPPEEVCAFCVTYENWPKFMGHVREIKTDGGIRSHWVVDGPGGIPVSWDAVITRFVPCELLAWKSVEGSTVEQAGLMRFERNPDGSTRLEIRMTYNPPAGALGHAFAALLGASPERQMDEDFVRLKSLIEHGKTSAPHKGTFTREQMTIATEGKTEGSLSAATAKEVEDVEAHGPR